MRLLSLDYDPVYGNDTTRSHFGSDRSVFDYDIVIWDPAQSLRNYTVYADSYRGLPSLSDGTSVTLNADIARRKTEFKEFVETGRILIAVVRPPQMCWVDSGKSEFSGTGRNQKRTRLLDQVDIWSAMPLQNLSMTLARGNRVNVEGDSPLAAFLRKHKSIAGYDAILSWAGGTPFASVAGTARIVGSYVKSQAGGLLVLMPALSLIRPQGDDDADNLDDESDSDGEGDHEDEDERKWIGGAYEVQCDLLDAVSAMTAGAAKSRPAWSLKYETADQSKLRQDISKQEARVEAARTKLAKMIERRDKVEAKNQLYLGTGDALAWEVKATLELLGGDVTQPAAGRDDWKVKFPEGNAVVEVKGVSKSAAERHAAQLEKWVAGEFEDTGVVPKGILVINTWRELDLNERVETDFPEQMIPYCEGRGHCLITGLQIFSVRMDIEADPERAAAWRSKILNTSGVLDGVPDWRSFLTTTEDVERPTHD